MAGWPSARGFDPRVDPATHAVERTTQDVDARVKSAHGEFACSAGLGVIKARLPLAEPSQPSPPPVGEGRLGGETKRRDPIETCSGRVRGHRYPSPAAASAANPAKSALAVRLEFALRKTARGRSRAPCSACFIRSRSGIANSLKNKWRRLRGADAHDDTMRLWRYYSCRCRNPLSPGIPVKGRIPALRPPIGRIPKVVYVIIVCTP
jgi:hypothetical protein